MVGVALWAGGDFGLPDASTVGVRSVSVEASSVDADSFIEEESGVTNVGTNSIAEILAIWALSLGYTSSGSCINSEARDASGAAINVA